MTIRQRLKYYFDMKNCSNSRYIIILGLILVTVVILRIYNLGRYSFWYDEAIAMLDARSVGQLFPLSNLFDGNFLLTHHDYLMLYTHGFVYYWKMLFGVSEFALRISSVIFSLLSIYGVYLLGRYIFNIKTAGLAVLLLAISPFHIYYAQELRPYAAVCFLTMFAVYSFLKALDTGKKRYWFIYIFSNILNIYFHYMSLLVLFSFCFFFVFNIKNYKRSLKPFILAYTTIIFLLTPVFLILYPNIQFVFHNKIYPAMSEFPIWAGKPNLGHLLDTFKNFSIGYNISYYSFGGRVISAVSFLLFSLGVSKFYKRMGGRLLLTCLFVPIMSLFLISQIQPSYVDRYLFSIFPLYLLGIAAGLGRLSKKLLFIFMFILVGFYCFGLKNYYLNHLPEDNSRIGVVKKQNVKETVKAISDGYRQNDRILHVGKHTVFPLKFYINQVSDNPDLIKEINRGTVIFTAEDSTLYTLDYERLYPSTFLPTEFKGIKDLEKNRRLWLIYSQVGQGVIDGLVGVGFKESRRKYFEGGILILFTKYPYLGIGNQKDEANEKNHYF